MQDQSHVFEEAAVLGQLREQKPSASFERPSLGNWMEKEERETRSAPVCIGRVCSQEEGVTPKASKETHSCFIAKEFSEETKSETASLRSRSVSKKFLEESKKEIIS